MEEEGEMVQITDARQLENHLRLWFDNSQPSVKKPVGYILSLEGADSLVHLSYLEKAYSYGLRVCGPAHYGPGRYAAGTGTTGALTIKGRELLQEMDRLSMILDVTHLTDEGFTEAIELFKGPVWASHHNCRSLVNHQRQLSDEQIKILVERGAVIGGALDTWMLTDNWIRGVDDPLERGVDLEKIVDHFDHICNIAGNCNHVAMGTDLDGAFGKEQTPYDVETIADIQKLKNILLKRGYTIHDIEKIFYRNWIRFLQNAWV
jgi:membrane dipeptidase